MAYQIPAFNTPNRQPTDINPLDAELAADPQAAAFWRRVRGDMTALASAFAQLTIITDNLAQLVYRINTDDRARDDVKAREIVSARNAAGESIEGMRRAAEVARQNVLDACTKAIDVSGFVGGASTNETLVNIERTRDAWKRCEMILGGIDTQVSGAIFARALRLATEAAERDDRFTQSALRQNLEAYLEAHGQKMTHQQVVSQLNVAMAPASAPEQRAAMQVQQVLEAGWLNLVACFQAALRYAKEKDAFRVSGLPGWPGQPPVTI